jgi:hypothetical protein
MEARYQECLDRALRRLVKPVANVCAATSGVW